MTEVSQQDVTALKATVFGNNGGNAPIAVAVNERPTIEQAAPPITETAPTEAAPVDATPAFDTNKWLNENFGYDSPDILKQQLDEFKLLKSKPPVAAFPELKDEQKVWLDYLTADGGEDKLLNSLEARKLVRNIDTLSDEQKLKMYIKMTNPLYDQELIDDEYNSLYSVQEDKYKGEDGSVNDPLGFRKAKVKVEQQRMNDVLKANEHFAQFKSKIDLPKIEAPLDERYVDFQKFSEEADKKYEKLAQASKLIKPEDVPLSFKFSDEASKFNVDVNIQMDKEGYDKALNTALSYVIVDDSYLDKDGSPLIGNMVKDIYFAQNREKVVSEIIVQAVNAERKRQIAGQKNFSESGRSFTPSEPSAVDKMREQIFGK